MTSAQNALLEAFNIMLSDWQKIREQEMDGERSVQMMRQIMRLLELIESLEKGEEL